VSRSLAKSASAASDVDHVAGTHGGMPDVSKRQVCFVEKASGITAAAFRLVQKFGGKAELKESLGTSDALRLKFAATVPAPTWPKRELYGPPKLTGGHPTLRRPFNSVDQRVRPRRRGDRIVLSTWIIEVWRWRPSTMFGAKD
jgi:hypothetical protein